MSKVVARNTTNVAYLLSSVGYTHTRISYISIIVTHVAVLIFWSRSCVVFENLLFQILELISADMTFTLIYSECRYDINEFLRKPVSSKHDFDSKPVPMVHIYYILYRYLVYHFNYITNKANKQWVRKLVVSVSNR